MDGDPRGGNADRDHHPPLDRGLTRNKERPCGEAPPQGRLLGDEPEKRFPIPFDNVIMLTKSKYARAKRG